MVQPNIANLSKAHKLSMKDPRPGALLKLIQVTEKYLKKEGEAKPDFIIWPEGAYPYHIRHNTKGSFAEQQARKWNSPLIVSAVGKSPKGATNSIFTFNSKGVLVQPPYDKTLLLAFGEYLPGEKWLPVQKLFSYYGRSFVRGTGEHKIMPLHHKGFNKHLKHNKQRPLTPKKNIPLHHHKEFNKHLKHSFFNNKPEKEEKPYPKNKVNLGFQICYEGLFDFFTRDLALAGAQIIVNVTNDSWYGSPQQAYQHLYMTLSRAIEVRRPLIRGTNTGVSAAVSAKGEVYFLSPLNKSLSHLQEVPYYSKTRHTIFTRWGYYINFCFLWGLFLFCLFFLKVRRMVQ